MEERLNNSYDIMSFTHGTKSEIEENKDLMLPYEPAIVVDTNEMVFKDEQGNIARVNSKEFEDVWADIEKNKSDILVNSKEFEDVWADIEKNKSDILLKLDKSEVFETGVTTSKTYVVKNENGTTKLGKWLDFMDNPTDIKYQTRLYTENGALFLAQNNDLGGLVFHEGNCPISKQPNGWCKLSNGMIMQWGYYYSSSFDTVDANTYKQFIITMPVAFTSKDYSFLYGVHGDFAGLFSGGISYDAIQLNSSVIYAYNPSSLPKKIHGYNWIAIGY